MVAERPQRHPDVQVWFAPDGVLLAGRPGRRAARVTAQVLEVLGACDGGRTLDDVAAAVAGGALKGLAPATALHVVRALLTQARDAGLLVDRERDARDEAAERTGYGHPAIHRRMLADEPRTAAFRRALEAVVRPGDVVIDVGAGTGVLSAFAARAGASAVHAVERACPGALRDVLAQNALADVVRVHAGDARALDLPPARVIVSEWLGVLLFGDGMWPSVASVRDRCLAPGGVMIPAAATLFVAPVEDPAVRAEGPGWWDAPRWGLDLSALGVRETRAPQRRLGLVPPDGLVAAPATLLTIDCARAGADAGHGSFDASFEVARDGVLDAFAAWFEADLAPGVRLVTGPNAPATHWKQDVLPTRPVPLRRGQRLEVRVTLGEDRPGDLTCALDVLLDGAPLLAARYL